MNNRTNRTPPINQIIVLILLTGMMACSDIEEGGITNSEVEKTQANIDKAPSADQALYVLNGEILDTDDPRSKDILSRLKPKYIESLEILKGKKATEEYGKKGGNGVLIFKLNDKEKALSDLRSDEEMAAMNKRVEKPADPNDDFFVAVENPPKLKGGMESVMKEVQYPTECREAQVQGRVTVQFIVNKQGKVDDPQVIRGIGGGCDEEAVRVVKQAEFEPGTQKGQPVRVQMSMPILFRLQ